MLILPMQGIAAVFAPLHKAMHATSVSAMPCHEQQKRPMHQMPQVNGERDTTQAVPSTMDEHTGGMAHDTDAANHLCCHHVYSCVPARALNTAAQKFSDVSRFVLPLATLFIPESPDRPPRG